MASNGQEKADFTRSQLSEREQSLIKLALWRLTDVVIYSTTQLYNTNTATFKKQYQLLNSTCGGVTAMIVT